VNLADSALQEGLTDLLASAGESVTFRAGSVTVIVNRTAFQDAKRENNLPDFDANAISRIEIAVDEVASRPKVGEVITDSRSIAHRIKRVTHTGQTWALDCEVLEE